jgi:hypothetical protein
MNNPDAPFCTMCRVPLTVAGYMEENRKISSLEEKVASLEEVRKWYKNEMSEI